MTACSIAVPLGYCSMASTFRDPLTTLKRAAEIDWPNLLTPNYQVRESQVVIAANSTGQLVGPDARRVLVAFAGDASAVINLSTMSAGISPLSHSLNQKLKDSMFTFSQHGALSQIGWFGANQAGVSTPVQVLELLYTPHSITYSEERNT